MANREKLLTLAAEIRQELANLLRIASEATETWAKRQSVRPDERQVYLKSTALELHNFYTAAERIFEHVAGDLNGALPQTHDWHLRLLRTMAVEVPEVRPAVLSEELVEHLSEYLRFRHVVRNVYGFELDEERMTPLMARIEATAQDLAIQVRALADYLEAMGRALNAE
jgi:hypothetical protein